MLAPVSFCLSALNHQSAGHQVAEELGNQSRGVNSVLGYNQDAAAVTSRGDFRRSTTTR